MSTLDNVVRVPEPASHTSHATSKLIEPFNLPYPSSEPEQMNRINLAIWLRKFESEHLIGDMPAMVSAFGVTEIIKHRERIPKNTAAGADVDKDAKAHPDIKSITIFDCFKWNPIDNVVILSVAAIVFALFSLAVSIVLKAHILNPFVALLALVAGIGFYAMARVEQHIQTRRIGK